MVKQHILFQKKIIYSKLFVIKIQYSKREFHSVTNLIRILWRYNNIFYLKVLKKEKSKTYYIPQVAERIVIRIPQVICNCYQFNCNHANIINF